MSGRGTDFGRLGSKFGRVGHKFCRLGSRFLSDAPKVLRFRAKKMSETVGIIAHFVGNPIINGVQIGPNFCRMGPKFLQNGAQKVAAACQRIAEWRQKNVGNRPNFGPNRSEKWSGPVKKCPK